MINRTWICAALMFCANAYAASTTNMVDQWGTPGETGWGLSIQQQNDTLFINMFVYDQAGQPTWYIGAVTPGVPAASGHTTFTGDWFKTRGPYFGGAWNQAAAGIDKVGTITFDVDTVTTAHLTYSVNGVTVSKHVERELWSYEDYSGDYVGALVYDQTHCSDFNGHAIEPGFFTISQPGSTSFGMVQQGFDGTTCTYAGTYSQLGHMGRVLGTLECSTGSSGTFEASEMERLNYSVSWQISAQLGACTLTGRFGGVKG